MSRFRSSTRAVVLPVLAAVAQLWTAPLTRASEGAEPAHVLRMKVGDIDTSAVENLLRAPIQRVDNIARARAGERLILQIDGPMTPERYAQLFSTGLTLGEYLPDFAYIVEATTVDVRQLQNLGFVVWVGRFDPAWRIDPELGTRTLYSDRRLALRAQGLAQVVIMTFAGAAPDAAVGAVQAAGETVLGQYPAGPLWLIDAIVTRETAEQLAQLPTVQYVEEAPDGLVRNHSNRWIAQSNVMDETPVWDRGLHGEGQIAGLIDETILESHCQFDDSLPPGNPNHRKIVGWRNAASPLYHGTHVAGTLAGDAPPYGEYSLNDGLAFAARISFSNVNHLFQNPSTLYQRLLEAHNDGARVHSNSWGDDGTRNYTTWCRQFDDYSYTFEDGMAAVAISYSSVVTTPENANSVIAVAACDDAPDQDSHAVGGSGPTIDGRRKPEVFAPGQDTVSASSFTTCGFGTDTGTSMACPVVAAAGVLARQYFQEGFYPSGAERGADQRNPSGALLRALLVNSSADMTGLAGYPGLREGWGRVTLDTALYFADDTAELLVQDVWNASGLTTGESASVTFEVQSAQAPLRITMAYTQPPAAVNASDPVINNLDLEIAAADGALYRGNFFAGGESAADGVADARNNVERVLRITPTPGTYTATIRATAVNAGAGIGRQGYALVVNGDLAGGCPQPPVGDLDGDCAVGLADLAELLSAFGSCTGEPAFNAAADFDTSGCVDLGDLAALLANFGV